MCSGTFQKQTNPELPAASPAAASTRRRARAIYPSPCSLLGSLCWALLRDHLPASPVWPSCCSVPAALTSPSSQGPPRDVGMLRRCCELPALWLPALCPVLLEAASFGLSLIQEAQTVKTRQICKGTF